MNMFLSLGDTPFIAITIIMAKGRAQGASALLAWLCSDRDKGIPTESGFPIRFR